MGSQDSIIKELVYMISYYYDGRKCTTKCPHGCNRLVGSFQCGDCEYFVTTVAKQRKVICSFKNNSKTEQP